MRLAVLADELTGLGWRLAGARVWTPEAKDVADCFRTAQSDADVLLLTASLAASVPEGQLQQALRAQTPLVLVMADLLHAVEPPDIEADVQRALGVTV